MRRDSLFWGTLLVILGGLFILQQAGLIGSAWGIFWPSLLILLGISVITGVFWRPRLGSQSGDSFEIDLQGASEASIRFNHGAGQVNFESGAPAGKLLIGSSGLAMSHSTHLVGDHLNVSVDAGPTFIPFIGPANGVWDFHLTPDVPIRLEINAGATSMKVNLMDLNVTYVDIDTGGSSTALTLPARGGTSVDIDAGAASFDIIVPEGVSAKINTEGVTALDIDESRFPRLAGGFYQSPNFEQAERKADIKIDAGAGRISIH